MREAPAVVDLVIAADSLVYIGDLELAFAAAAIALESGGMFALSLETWEGDGFRLGGSMRFAHARAYVERTAAAVVFRSTPRQRSVNPARERTRGARIGLRIRAPVSLR